MNKIFFFNFNKNSNHTVYFEINLLILFTSNLHSCVLLGNFEKNFEMIEYLVFFVANFSIKLFVSKCEILKASEI